MDATEIQQAIERLTELQAAQDLLKLRRQELIDSIIPDEIKAKLAEIDAEFAPMQEAVVEQAAELEAQIKAAVIAHGSSVKTEHLQAVYNKGRVSWDTAKLDGLMIIIPQLAAARKEGAPSVSFRKA